MSKDQASMDSGVTALIVESLSRRAQLLSPLILTQTMYLVHSNEGVGPDLGRESFVMSLCSGSLFQGCLLSDSWLLRAQPPFFAIPSLVFKSAFHVDFLIIFWAILHKVVGTPVPETTSAFLLV